MQAHQLVALMAYQSPNSQTQKQSQESFRSLLNRSDAQEQTEGQMCFCIYSLQTLPTWFLKKEYEIRHFLIFITKMKCKSFLENKKYKLYLKNKVVKYRDKQSYLSQCFCFVMNVPSNFIFIVPWFVKYKIM